MRRWTLLKRSRWQASGTTRKVSDMTREQYLYERELLIDDYIATGQHRRYERHMEELKARAEAAGLFKEGE